MITNLKKAVVATAIPALLLGSASAFAGTLITSFSFDNRSGFLDYSPKVTDGFVNGVRTNPGGPQTDIYGDGSTVLPAQLFWGKCINGTYNFNCLSSLAIHDQGPLDDIGDANPSDLSRVGAVGGQATGTLITNGDWVESLNYVHNNKVINPFDEALRDASILAQVTLESIAPPGTTIGPLEALFNIKFKETLNSLSGAGCPTGTSGGLCSDLFVLLDAATVLSADLGVIDGYHYFLDEMIEGLTNPLSAAQCALVGLVGDDCTNAGGLITREGQSNPFRTFIRIRAEEVTVPEPSVLALMGLSLVGFAVGGRRRKSK